MTLSLMRLERIRKLLFAARQTQTDPAMILNLTEAIDDIDDLMVAKVRTPPDFTVGLSELLKDMQASVAINERKLNGVLS